MGRLKNYWQVYRRELAWVPDKGPPLGQPESARKIMSVRFETTTIRSGRRRASVDVLETPLDVKQLSNLFDCFRATYE